MNATLSTRQLRLVVLLVLVVVVAGGYLVVTRDKSTTSSTSSSTPAVTTPAHTKTTPTPSKTHTHTATPVKLNTHGLPVKVALALKHHSVVVVSLSQPNADVDQLAALEAKVGALGMKAGYVNIDVYHQRPGTAVLRKFGVLTTPDVLVVKRPGVVYSVFKGFVDHDVVAQAVADAR
jgi:hypothetical protein